MNPTKVAVPLLIIFVVAFIVIFFLGPSRMGLSSSSSSSSSSVREEDTTAKVPLDSRDREVTQTKYDTVRSWTRNQPELKAFILDKLKNGKLPGKLTKRDYQEIASKSVEIDKAREKLSNPAFRADFKKAMESK